MHCKLDTLSFVIHTYASNEKKLSKTKIQLNYPSVVRIVLLRSRRRASWVHCVIWCRAFPGRCRIAFGTTSRPAPSRAWGSAPLGAVWGRSATRSRFVVLVLGVIPILSHLWGALISGSTPWTTLAMRSASVPVIGSSRFVLSLRLPLLLPLRGICFICYTFVSRRFLWARSFWRTTLASWSRSGPWTGPRVPAEKLDFNLKKHMCFSHTSFWTPLSPQ